MGDMDGQVAVVTGGTRGIGLAISERLLNRGVTVAAGYATNHDQAREFADKYADRGVSVHQGNVGHNEDVLRVFGEVLDRHGHVDIVVNNAGITIDKTVRKMDPREWDHVIHVNLSGAFYASRAVLQHMLDRGYGRIINISSIIGSAGGFGQANYAAAKSGMFGLTMSLAIETAGKGITVNTVTPGFITTDMTAAVPADARWTHLVSGRRARASAIASALPGVVCSRTNQLTQPSRSPSSMPRTRRPADSVSLR